jgi:murein DD-endopeptidase MepM/ murein hydrolase activator NlpD
MMNEFEDALILEFPLRGEWMTPNTPGKIVPSHGTDILGQRYAYDFWQVDRKIDNYKFYDGRKCKYYFRGIPLENCYCWGKEVFAPCDGKIVKSEDGCKERNPVNFFTDIFAVLKNGFTFNPKKKGFNIHPFIGNYIIMEIAENIFAFFAHFQNGSITVKSGDNVNKGQILGKVGHSGNSTAPHLHFHIMDSVDLLNAKGIPCVFEKYELLKDNRWKIIKKGIPSDKDIIKY